MIKNRVVLIDAFALIYRSFYAIPPLTTKDGKLVNAVYGFASALLTTIKDLEPEYLAVGIDMPKPTIRKQEYAEYKAHRKPAPDELISQIPYVTALLKAFNIPLLGVGGYEGEDVIATIIEKCGLNSGKCGLEFIIVTGDSDMFQLINDHVKVYSMARGASQAVLYDKEKIKERYGVTPEQFVDLKALKGDQSDNIPGVPGIGEKTAAKLVVEYGNLDKIYENIDKINGKNQTLLKENKDSAYLSYKLSKITDGAPLEFDLKAARVHDYNLKEVINLFNELGFRSLIVRLPKPEIIDNQQKLF